MGASIHSGSAADVEQPTRERPARRVLIIEDNVDAAETLSEVVRLFELEVEVAFAGDAGLALAQTFAPDLVLCDLGLPGLSGYQVARAMRADPQLRRARLVAVSGYARSADVALALEAGFDEHAAKPLSLARLEAILRGACLDSCETR